MITMRTIVPIPMYMAWFLPSCQLTGLADLGAGWLILEPDQAAR